MANDTGQIELYQGGDGEVAQKDPQFHAWLLRFVSLCKQFFDGNEARLQSLEARVAALEEDA